MIKQFYLIHRWNPNRTTTQGHSGYGSNGNDGVLHILQSSRTEALVSESLMPYPGHSSELYSWKPGLSKQTIVLTVSFVVSVKINERNYFQIPL